MDTLCAGIAAPTVILLDEIGGAMSRTNDLDDEFWESLRALGPQLDGNLGFVLAAHLSPVELAHTTGHSSPFFNIFGYTARLGPLSEAEALIAVSPLPFAQGDIDWIVRTSRGWPILLQTICRERLAALEAGETGDAWRDEALAQIQQYQALP
jgi:hypothetical protein